ncbi:MAG: LamG-like jellyroll fold domain-containing protein [Caldilineaceae bacterium]
MRIWPLQHQPQAGSVGYVDDGGTASDGPAYALEGTISDHTADSITIYFDGQTATSDPNGPEVWSLDNIQVTLERDETSIPLTDQSFTLAAWAKQTVANQPGILISQGTRQTNQGLHFGFRDTPVFTCAFYGDDLNTADASLIDAEWHHWVCTYDAASKTRTLYRDGIQVAQDQASANYQGLGETYIGSAFGENWYFNGQLDEVATWRVALTAADVVDLYNKVKVQDQSVMVGTIVATTGTPSFDHSAVTLRETATNVGAIAQTTNRTLTVDADAPQICQGAGRCPINDQYVRNTGTLVVAGTAEDPTSYIRGVEVNDGGWQPASGTAAWSYAWNIGALGDGEHTLPVRATDAVGHVSPIYDLAVVIDSTPPQATFAAGAGAVQRPTRDDTGQWLVSLTGSVTDPVAGSKPGSGVAQVDVLLDGADMLAGQGWQPATIDGTSWTIDYVLPGFDAASNAQTDPTGTYTVTLRATDAVSNTTPAGAYPSTQIRLDASGPTIAATAPLSNTQLITTALTIMGAVEDAGAIAGVDVNFTPAEQVDALNGALVYHAFDADQASQYFDDLSGSGNAAVCDPVACPENGVAGQRERAVHFNGVNQSLTIPNSSSFNFGADDDFTIAFWVQVDATQPDTARSDHSIVDKWSNAGGGYPFVVRYVRATGEIFAARYDGTNGAGLNSTQSVNDGQFHHVAFIKKAGYLYLYVDGELNGDAIPDTTTGSTANANPIYLGMRGGDGGTNHFAGTLDELLIYGRALADYEIADLVAYGQTTRNAATVAGDTWSYVVPEGSDGIEGLYQIDVRGIDALGNVTSWAGSGSGAARSTRNRPCSVLRSPPP